MSATYHTDPLLALAESAWRNLRLEAPIDLHAVTRKLGIRLIRWHFSQAVSGAYLITPCGRPVIAINALDPFPVQRFSWCHELGHHLIRDRGARGRICVLGPYQVSDDPYVERRCDRFAGTLLMPERLVRDWWADLAGNPTQRLPVMAERFGVSISALRIRLKELDLHEKLPKLRRRLR